MIRNIFLILIVFGLMLSGCTQSPDQIEISTPPPITTPEPDEELVQPSIPTESDYEITSVDMIYTWVYNGEEHSANIELFTEEAEFFSTAEVPGTPTDESFYNGLVHHEYQEDVYQELAEELREYGYDDDETARLGLAMISNLKFNEAYDRWVFSYETLYAKEGVCSDKTILAVGLLDELGYDVVIFDYEETNHMGVGIRCQEQYAHWEDYCFVDVTDGHKFVTEDTVYFADLDAYLGEPSAVFDVSNNTKTFDAKWDYEQSIKLNDYLDRIEPLAALVGDDYILLSDAKEEMVQWEEDLTGWYDSRQDYLADEEAYVEYSAAFEEGLIEWTFNYNTLRSMTEWLSLYEDEYGVDLNIPEYIMVEWESLLPGEYSDYIILE